MRQSPELLAAHQARRVAFDPLLAPSRALPPPQAADTVLSCPGGVALVRDTMTDPDSWGHTFFASHESKLVPKVDGPEALAALLDLWAAHGGFRPGRDSIATITWPSRDTEVVRVLVERGFMPQSVFAVRLSGQSAADQHVPTDITVRRAIPRDADAVQRLWMEQLRWETQFGYTAIRPSSQARLAEQVIQAVDGRQKRAWLAERDGEAVGLVVVQPPEHAQWAAKMIRVGPAAYLSCAAVAAKHRGVGAGTVLIRRVHAELDTEGIAALLLHYTAVNPLSGPFWSRHGYRPLLTAWTRGTVG